MPSISGYPLKSRHRQSAGPVRFVQADVSFVKDAPSSRYGNLGALQFDHRIRFVVELTASVRIGWGFAAIGS